MNPNEGFKEGQESYDIAIIGQSSNSDSSGAGEDTYQTECYLRACSPRTLVLEGRREGYDLQTLCEGISIDAPTRHYYVDM